MDQVVQKTEETWRCYFIVRAVPEIILGGGALFLSGGGCFVDVSEGWGISLTNPV